MFPAVSGWASITFLFLDINKEYTFFLANLRQYFETASQWHYQVLNSVSWEKRICKDSRGKSESGDVSQKNVFSVLVEEKTFFLCSNCWCFIIMIMLTGSWLSQVVKHISYSILSPTEHKSCKPLSHIDTKTIDNGWMMMKDLMHIIYLPSYDYILLLN